MRIRKLLCLFTALVMSVGLIGCGSSSKSESNYEGSVESAMATEEYATDDVYSNEYDMEATAETADAGAADTVKTPEVASNRKLIKNVSMQIETESFDQLIANVEKKTEELGGYAESKSINGVGYYDKAGSRYASMTIRIPSKNMDQFVSAVSKASNVINKTENVEDITLRYVDTKAHVESLKIEQERLQELLKESKDLDTMITLESRLTQVRYELEGYESQIRTYDNLVDYSTITLNISEVTRLTPTTEVKLSRFDKIRIGFMENLYDVIEGVLDFVVGLIIAIPYFIVIAVIVLIILMIVKLCTHKSKKKRDKIEAQKAASATATVTTAKESVNHESGKN
ncbi:MAG: DUF4349 domain-containing protein [Clostridia bacterium]|nr:DUF4349 domain-containing protein [Clostridia bacterium]